MENDNEEQTTVRIYKKDVAEIKKLYEYQVGAKLKLLNNIKEKYKKEKQDTREIDTQLAQWSILTKVNSFADRLALIIVSADHDFEYALENYYPKLEEDMLEAIKNTKRELMQNE